MILSIIVPMYNTQLFVERCLNSIVGQMASKESYEVIVVNDGSTDASLDVVSSYIQDCTNVTVVNQKNAGLGAARNTGLERARGRYVWFVDSDDFIIDGCLPLILADLQQHEPQVMCLGMTCADEGGRPIDWIQLEYVSDGRSVLTGGEFFDLNYKWTYNVLYIFQTALLRENGIQYQPRINMQDAEMLPRALIHAERVWLSGRDAYVYVKRSSSFINNNDPGVRDRYFVSVIEVVGRLDAFRRSVMTDKRMESGLRKKLNVMDEILLMSFLYDEMNLSRRKERLAKLVAADLYPFRFDVGGTWLERTKKDLLRHGVNISPLFFPPIYESVRRAGRFVKNCLLTHLDR